MASLQASAEEFLAQKNIAVTGVSRDKPDAANGIYKKLKKEGYNVYPINPNAAEVEGDKCYPNVQALAGQIDGVVIASHPDVTMQIMEDCATAGIPRVWIHRSIGNGSMDDTAVTFGQEHNMTVIPGGCPMMFCTPVDFGHKCMRWWFDKTGKLPKQVDIKHEMVAG